MYDEFDDYWHEPESDELLLRMMEEDDYDEDDLILDDFDFDDQEWSVDENGFPF